MRLHACFAFSALTLAAAGCLELSGFVPFEREIERTFQVSPGSLVEVDISGGAIRTRPGAPGVVKVSMHQQIFADSERDAQAILSGYDVTIGQSAGVVTARARRKEGLSSWRVRRGHSFSSTVEVPPDVRLKLRTSGGAIIVQGERSAAVDATTSGGAMEIAGGTGDIAIRTSGGSIQVDRALGALVATTSGGNIRVGYVGAASRGVELDTSGGNIRATVDDEARFDLSANTSGGSVAIEDLNLQTVSRARTRVAGHLNGGGARFRAHTSGGNITLKGANADGEIER